MFRRSRFSVRPNVGTAGRTAAASQETPPVNQESGDTAKDTAPSNTDTAVADKSVTPSENPAAQGDGSDQNGDSNTSSAAVQRRKRFSVKPKVLPGRPSALARTAKSPVKAANSPVKTGHETFVEVSEKANNVPKNNSQRVAAAAPQGLRSPRRQRPSEDSQQPEVQAKSNLVPSDSSAAAAEDLQEESPQLADTGKQLETASDCQVKESHFKVPEKVPPSLPSKDVTEISEKAKTLVSSKLSRPTSAAAFSLSRLLNDPSDLHRLAKARKLRELLKEEIHKEKRLKKSKLRSKEFTLDPAKMTMRDLIHYLPESNPMTSCLEVAAPEDETVVPPLPGREDPLERAQEPAESQREEEEEEEEEAADGDEEEALLVPQVKVAEDGTLIIDESSLTVEVQRAKGPNLIQDRDPIFERGSTTTYSSFRKGNYSKPWSAEETDMFFLAISMVGTDFTMICQLFPHRARSEIKNKFKKEERQNSWRIDKAFRERRKMDIEYFSKLLEMILEVEKNRKKHRLLAEKNEPKKKRRRAKGKKAQQKLSDVEEDEDEIPDLEDDDEEVGEEEENVDLCSESQGPVSQPKKQRKRKLEQDATSDAPDEGKRELRDTRKDQVCIPEHAEASHLEDDVNPDRPFADPTSASCANKPDKPPPGRAAQPLATLSQICDKNSCNSSPSSTSKNNTRDEADVTGNDGATEEQENHETTLQQGKKRKLADDDVSSEEEAICQPRKPTRYGRMPKPTKPLSYPTKEDTHSSSSSSEATSASTTGPSAPRPKSKCPAKKKGKTPSVQEPKRPKLITLRASQSEYSDDDDEDQEWVGAEQQLGCSSGTDSAAAFVPASLCSLHPVSVEVEETMEELSIFASMPDVLGISQDSLSSDVKTVKNETCSTVPREHQLDLLVDVIDCLPAEYTVSEEDSYNEAAHTLLTISNLAHGTQATENHSAVNDQSEAISVDDENLQTDQATASLCENSEISTQGSADSLESVANMQPQSSPNEGDATPASDQKTETPPQLPPSPEKLENMSSQTRRSHISKIKPNPVLRQILRPIRSKTQPEALKESVQIKMPDPSSSETAKIPSTAEANKTELSQCLSNEICEEKVPKAAAGCQENQESNGIKLSLEPMTTDELLTPGRTSDSTDSASDKSASHASVSELNTVKDSAASQTRRSRFQKAKPNLPMTARPVCSKSQSKSTPDPRQKSAETDISPPGKSQDLGFDSVPSKKKTDPELMVQLQSSVATADHIASDNERTQEATAELSSMSESTEEQITSHVGEVEMLLGAPVQEISDHSASGDISTEAPVVCQREETDSSSKGPVRKSRSQKVKPKPNLPSTSRSVRSNRTSANKAVNANCHPPSNPWSHEETVGDVREPPESTSAVKVGERAGPGASTIPTPDTSSSLTAAEALMVTEAEQTDQPSVEITSASKDLPVQSEEQGTNTTAPTPKTGGELSGMVESAEGLGPGSAVMSPPAQEILHPPPSKDLPVSQEEVAPTCQTRTGRRIKHKPNLLQTSTIMQSKPQGTEEPVAATPVEQSSNPGPYSCLISASQKDQTSGATPAPTSSQSPETSATSEPCSTGAPMKDTPLFENQLENIGSSEHSAKSEPQRRRRFPKAKPNLGPSTRNIQTKPHSNARNASELHYVDIVTPEQHEQMPLQPPEQDREHSISAEMSRDGQNNEATTSDSVAIEMQAVAKKESAQTGSNTPASGDAADISEGQSSENVTAETEMKSVSVDSLSGVKERPQQACSEGKSRDPGSSKTTEDGSLAQSTRGDQSEPVTSAKSSGKVPTRRGRLVKPKPNLGQNSRSKQIQNSAQTDKDSGGSEVQMCTGQPVGCAVEQKTVNNPTAGADVTSEVTDHLDQPRDDPSVAASSLGCSTEVTNDARDLTTSTALGNQIPADFTIFSEMLSAQVPADPDEPFFILSLTEIPVGSLAEMGDSSSEPLPLLPVTELSQQQSVSGECLDKPLAHVIVSTEGSGLVTVGESPLNPAASQGSDLDNPVDPHERTLMEASVSPEAEHRPPGQRRRRSHSPAVHTASVTASFISEAAEQPQRKKRDRNVSERHGSPSEREGRLQNVTLDDGTEDSSSGEQTTHTRTVRASSNGSPCDERKLSAPEPAASTSHSVATAPPPPQETVSVPLLALPQLSEEDAELISDTEEEERTEHSGAQEEEPPTSVSQYFLSDIFTEVEDD